MCEDAGYERLDIDPDVWEDWEGETDSQEEKRVSIDFEIGRISIETIETRTREIADRVEYNFEDDDPLDKIKRSLL